MQLTLTLGGHPGPHLPQHRLHGPLGCHQTLNNHSLNINLTDEGGVSIGTVEISNLQGRPALRVTDSDQREQYFDFLDQRSPVLTSGQGGTLAYTDDYSVASGIVHAQLDAVGGEMISDTTTIVEAARNDGVTYRWTKNQSADSPSAASGPDATSVMGLDPLGSNQQRSSSQIKTTSSAGTIPVK